MRILKVISLIVLIMIIAVPVWGAARISIWPIRIFLTPDQKIDGVTVRNRGEKEVKAQVYAKTWDMDVNGEYIETDTGDFVFFPRLLTIPAGQEKKLRVGYNGKFPPVEKPYRLYIQELPEIKTPEKETEKMDTVFSFLLKLSVPIFVRQSNDPEPIQAEIAGIAAEPENLEIELHNVGTRNFLLKRMNVRLLDRTGEILDTFDDEYTQRVLPKRRVFLEIPMKTEHCEAASALELNFLLYDSKTYLEQTINLESGCKMPDGSIPMIQK